MLPAAARPLHASFASGRRSARRLSRAAAAGATESPPPRVLVPIATGSEEVETACLVDLLRRAGCQVTLASVESSVQVVMSRSMLFCADALLADLPDQQWDCIALPGGMPGAAGLRDCARLSQLLRAQSDAGRLIAAICAAPVVALQPLGLLDGRRATAHPAFSDQLPSSCAGSVAARVVIDGQVLTSRGPGTAMELALAVAERLCGLAVARAVAGPLVLPPAEGAPAALLPGEWRLQ